MKASSGVSDQPKSSRESIKGAKTRALNALKEYETENKNANVSYSIGIEGGIEKIEDLYFQSGWIAIYDCKNDKFGIGTSARVEVSNKIATTLINDENTELSDVIDSLSGKENIGKKEGYFGIVTNNTLSRANAYSHGVLMAFAKFVSDSKYWD